MKITGVTPIGARCVVEPHKAATESASGLVLEHNSNASGAKSLGKIIKIGTDSKFQGMEGKNILFRRYALDEQTYIDSTGRKEVYIIDDSEVLAFLEVETDDKS